MSIDIYNKLQLQFGHGKANLKLPPGGGVTDTTYLIFIFILVSYRLYCIVYNRGVETPVCLRLNKQFTNVFHGIKKCQETLA